RPSGYEPDELPSCSTPRPRWPIIGASAQIASKYIKKSLFVDLYDKECGLYQHHAVFSGKRI
ncbi:MULTISPECIES: hypothetical protein, partial [Aeromonas]